MNKEKLTVLYKKYELTADDIYKHQHYLIITRSGIDKIQGIEGIEIHYELYCYKLRERFLRSKSQCFER